MVQFYIGGDRKLWGIENLNAPTVYHPLDFNLFINFKLLIFKF